MNRAERFFLSSLPPPPSTEPEMTEFESAFLCGLLKKFRPKKIVEVGVAAGGTTAIILECLENIGQKYSMVSIDISKDFHLNKQLKTGFLAKDTKKDLKVGTHKFYFDTVLPLLIDNIGGDIDFLILDTAHILPGEVIDFLIALPYLKENAVVCLHDISECQTHPNANFLFQHATTALFAAVHADKILNFASFISNGGDIINGNLSVHYPNIAAFQINENTLKNIENVFLTLVLRWRYLPDDRFLKAYSSMLEKIYPQELFMIFLESLRMNIRNLVAESQLHVAQNKS